MHLLTVRSLASQAPVFFAALLAGGVVLAGAPGCGASDEAPNDPEGNAGVPTPSAATLEAFCASHMADSINSRCVRDPGAKGNGIEGLARASSRVLDEPGTCLRSSKRAEMSCATVPRPSGGSDNARRDCAESGFETLAKNVMAENLAAADVARCKSKNLDCKPQYQGGDPFTSSEVEERCDALGS